MCTLLKQLYLVFEAACQGQEKVEKCRSHCSNLYLTFFLFHQADKEALLSFNPKVFQALFL
jgi:hypothetical protein